MATGKSGGWQMEVHLDTVLGRAALLRRRVWFAFKPPADQQVSPTDQRFASAG
jgi:hypothetical protein